MSAAEAGFGVRAIKTGHKAEERLDDCCKRSGTSLTVCAKTLDAPLDTRLRRLSFRPFLSPSSHTPNPPFENLLSLFAMTGKSRR